MLDHKTISYFNSFSKNFIGAIDNIFQWKFKILSDESVITPTIWHVINLEIDYFHNSKMVVWTKLPNAGKSIFSRTN